MKNLKQIMIISEGVRMETIAILMDISMWPQKIINDILWNKLEVYLKLEKEIYSRNWYRDKRKIRIMDFIRSNNQN